MFTIIAFLLCIAGQVNWLMIGLFQYDYIAGIFGFQASIFSRIFYVLFGLSAIILIFKLIKGKGVIAVFSRKNKKDLEKNFNKLQDAQNVESSNEVYHNYQNNRIEDQHNIDSNSRANSNSSYPQDSYYNERRYDRDSEDFDRHYRR